jgi:glycosyltransferase involved in cell wall biosynthesis
MTRILLITDDTTGAIPFYRSIMPWSAIQKEYDDIVITIVDLRRMAEELAWNVFTAHDVLFIQNPRVPKHLEIIKAAKSHGLKVWSDYDDCYLDIPKDNNLYRLINVGTIAHVTKESLMYSDITTVTTNYLKEFLSPYSERIRVIPNAFPLEFLSPESLGEITQGTHNFISWRGSEAHKRNLREFSKEITEVALSNPEWSFKFFGLNPEYFEDAFNYTHHDFERLFDSFYRMKKFSSKVHIVTLYERPFNLSKSNIAFVEATIAGSVVLAPAWEEWMKPGVVTYTTKEDFKDKLNALLKGEYNLDRQFEESRDYILNNLSLKKINKERLKILKDYILH